MASMSPQDSGEVACHASRIMFGTAVQCVNHRRNKQYRVDLKTSGLQEDADFLALLEHEARHEKDKYLP